MKRNEFFVAPREKEDQAKARSDFRQAERRRSTGYGWMCYSATPEKYLAVADVKHAELFLHFHESAHVLSSKVFYLFAVHILDRERLQPSWGRIQQQGEVDYDLIVSLLARHRKREWLAARQPSRRRVALEEFEGFVEEVDDEVAYVTLKDKTGQKLQGEYPASELETLGIHERRRFYCRTFDVGGGNVKIELSAIPDRQVSEERQRAIDEELRRAMGGDDGPEDDY